jgi:hypothetical protein
MSTSILHVSGQFRGQTTREILITAPDYTWSPGEQVKIVVETRIRIGRRILSSCSPGSPGEFQSGHRGDNRLLVIHRK